MWLQESMQTARVSRTACGPGLVLSSVIGLQHCANMKLAPPAVYLYASNLVTVTSFHCHVPVAKYQTGQCMLTARTFTDASIHAVGHCPFCLPWPLPLLVCLQWSWPLHRHLQMDPKAKHVHTTSSGHYCCMQCAWHLDLEAQLRTHAVLAASVNPPQSSPRIIQLLRPWTTAIWANQPQSHCFFGPDGTTCFLIWSPVTGPLGPGSQHITAYPHL